MNIELEIRSLIKYLDEECDQPYEEIFDQIVRLVNERVGELLQEIDRLKKQDLNAIYSYAVERKKLIEGLLTIMYITSEDGVHWKLDKCYTTARNILKEIGVLSK